MLDDLAAELNGTAQPAPAPLAPKQAEPAPAIIDPPAPPVETLAAKALAAAATKSAPAPAPETKASETPASDRSFEGVVADMLRPLLEKWIDENMPRIVERALQRDATLGRKPNP